MRLIDSEYLEKIAEQQGYVTIDDILDAPTIAPEPNPPLTLEELRDIRQLEWLYIEVIDDCDKHESAYYQVHYDYSHGEALCCGYPGLGFEFEYSDYGKTWLAYRRKSEEGKKWND